jgi:ATP-dependent DNA helicase RecG
MTILNANRFGISSLHQIRGRVGRGAIKSYCYLIGEATVPEAEERLNALVESNDGFWLAEKDLEIRGEGSLFGQLQSGANDMFVGNLKEHKDLLDIAKTVAKQAKTSRILNKEIDLLYSGREIQA